MASLFYLLPGAILGAFLSYIFPFIVGGFKYLIRILRHQRVIEGDWYSYHYTKLLHQPMVRQLRWTIKQDFRGHFTAVCRGDDADAIGGRVSTVQKGTAILENGHLVISVFSRADGHHSTCQIHQPGALSKVVTGIWLGLNLDGMLMAGPIIFTREELAPEEAEALLKAGAVLKSRVSVRSTFRMLEAPK